MSDPSALKILTNGELTYFFVYICNCRQWGIIIVVEGTPPGRPLLYIINVPDDIKEHLLKAVSLVNKHFSDMQTMDVHWEQDPEVGEKWIVIKVTIEDEVDQVLDRYDQYTEEWIASTSWPERERIRFSYNIA